MKRFVLMCWVVAAGPVWAEAQCPDYSDVESISIARALTEVSPLMSACSDDPIATGLYGGLLLRSGQMDTALIWLEKALLLDPSQSGVQADYALALAAQGDRFSSEAIANDLLAQEAVPQSVVNALSELAVVDRWTPYWSASVGTGFSSNTEFVPDVGTLDLTFGDDGAVSVPLVDPTAPSSGALFQQSVRAMAVWDAGDMQIAPDFRISERRLAGSERADYLSTRVGVAFSPMESDSLYDFSYGQLSYGDGQERDEWRVGFEQPISVRVGSCGLTAVADVASQSFGRGSNDTQIYRAGLAGECADNQFWLARFGIDAPTDDRLGGDKTLISLVAGQRMAWYDGVLTTRAGLSLTTDKETYSPFLDFGAPREITTLELSGAWRRSLAEHLDISAEASLVRQTSNITLFDVDASEFSINLIYTD